MAAKRESQHSKAIEIDGKYYIAYIGRADAYVAKGQTGSAVEDLNKVIEQSDSPGLVKIAKDKLNKLK